MPAMALPLSLPALLVLVLAAQAGLATAGSGSRATFRNIRTKATATPPPPPPDFSRWDNSSIMCPQSTATREAPRHQLFRHHVGFAIVSRHRRSSTHDARRSSASASAKVTPAARLLWPPAYRPSGVSASPRLRSRSCDTPPPPPVLDNARCACAAAARGSQCALRHRAQELREDPLGAVVHDLRARLALGRDEGTL